jgi:pimeloyl-ACP methyl ester carboxylesterase
MPSKKRYVRHRETGEFTPSDDFYRYNHYPQLIKDQKDFIQTILSKQDHVGKQVIIFGVSEGGNISARLASELQLATHLMILGSGGMVGIDEFRLWGKRYNIDFDLIYQDVKEHPNSIERMILGHTYKYWASVLPVDPMQSLKDLSIPILVAIGGNDEMSPVESVHYLKSEFKRLNKGNLTVKIFADCDHGLNDSAGINHRGELFQIASMWLSGK